MKNSNNAPKKPFYKKWWFFIIVAILLIAVISNANDDDYSSPIDTSDDATSAENNDLISDTNEEADLPPVNDNDLLEDETSSTPTESFVQNESLVFELIAGQQGEYGKIVTYNAGTEFEESFYAFFVPAGTYRITNTGEYMSQINVYSDAVVKNDAGWEEPANTYFVQLVDTNRSAIVTIAEGQHIELAEPAVFLFEKQ